MLGKYVNPSYLQVGRGPASRGRGGQGRRQRLPHLRVWTCAARALSLPCAAALDPGALVL